MSGQTIAIQSPGDMGHGVGRDLVARGFQVVTCLAGRSQRSVGLAQSGGLESVPDFETLVTRADLILSIVPPSSAVSLAQAMRAAMDAAGNYPAFADCNAIAPSTAHTVADCFDGVDATFIDAGIIGLAPGKSELPTRFYCSGPDVSGLETIAGGGIRVHPLGPNIGKASAMKMVYASVTKGTNALHAAALTAAYRHQLFDTYQAEAGESLPGVWASMNRMVPRLALDAGRWVGEMHEIAEFFASSGVPNEFHRGAAKMFELLNQTPIAAETRETVDETRTLVDALVMYAEAAARLSSN
ncbi:MAG: DUF1932 domain-containing protein [Pseudomonadota bacterium]